MKEAYVCEEKFSPSGRCIERKRAVGGIVVWGIVVTIAIFAGVSVPSSIWRLLKFW
jgi:hypothetical protein